MKDHSRRMESKHVSAVVVAAALFASVMAVGVGMSGGATPYAALPPGAVVLTAPALKGVPAVPGHGMAPAYSISSSPGLLTLSPSQATIGRPFTISAKGLAHNATVMLTWNTSSVTWVADPEPNTANYMGRQSKSYDVVLATIKTDANGNFSYKAVVPSDFGGIHEINAIIGGVSVAYNGFVIRRTVTISPTSGPIGTPITITYTGLGSSLYAGGGSVLWDNRYVGEMMANWTRGTGKVVIRAAGPVGAHFIQVGDGIAVLYMNIRQSPLPYATGQTLRFVTTADHGPASPSVTWPDNVAPTVSARTTLQAGIIGSVNEALSTTMGAVNSRVTVKGTGITSGTPVSMYFVTVEGSRVNCTSVCWNNVEAPLGTAQVAGGAIHANVTIPDGLGGWHVILLTQGTKPIAQEPFYVKESIVGVSPLVVHQGQHFTVHIKGVGWTQFDNTLAVDYDNSFVGYACGFNSNGDMVVDMYATGSRGTHIIDLYPLLYTNQPSYSNTPYGMVPVLSFQKDEPALALGYHVPAFHFAITVVP